MKPRSFIYKTIIRDNLFTPALKNSSQYSSFTYCLQDIMPCSVSPFRIPEDTSYFERNPDLYNDVTLPTDNFCLCKANTSGSFSCGSIFDQSSFDFFTFTDNDVEVIKNVAIW